MKHDTLVYSEGDTIRMTLVHNGESVSGTGTCWSPLYNRLLTGLKVKVQRSSCINHNSGHR